MVGGHRAGALPCASPWPFSLARPQGPSLLEASTWAASSQRYPGFTMEPLRCWYQCSEVDDDSKQRLLSSYYVPDCDEQDVCIIALNPLRLLPLISLLYKPQ